MLKFIGHTQPKNMTPLKYFVTVDLQAIIRTKFVGIFTIYARTKILVSRHSNIT